MWEEIEEQSRRSAQTEMNMQNNMWLYNRPFNSFDDEDDEDSDFSASVSFDDRLNGLIIELQNIEEAFWLEYQVLND